MPAPACPRCAYDLSGAVATWQDSCPLTGLCPECGLDFEWTDIFTPERNRVRGLFEHARGAIQSARWLEYTWFLTLWPPRFWRTVRLEAPVVPRRVAAWPVLITLVVWSAGSIVTSAAGLASAAIEVMGRRAPLAHDVLRVVINAWIDPFAAIYAWSGPWSLEWNDDLWRWGRYYFPLCLATLTWAVVITALPTTLRAARVRWQHTLRAVAYSLAWIPAVATAHVLDGLYWASQLFVQNGGWINPNTTPPRPAHTELLHHISPWLLPLITAWLFAWWWCALHTGFRLKSAGRIWQVLAVPAALAWLIGFLLSGVATRFIAKNLL